MDISLAQRHIYCYQAFASICNGASVGTAHHGRLQEEFDKYTLWAGNVGAAHSGKTYQLSLDYRLREAPFYKDQVSKLLDILTRQVNKTADILTGARTPFEELSSESESDNDSKHSTLDEDSPWEISSDSEGETLVGPNQNNPTDISQHDASASGVQTSSPQQKEDHNGASDTTELGQLLESVRVTVTCLYKLPLRKPASVDRLGDQATEDVVCFQPLDLMYIKDKFPLLDPDVAVRFAKMITRRRQLLLYRKRHRDKLRTEATAPTPQMTTQEHHSIESVHGTRSRAQDARDVGFNAPSQRESNRDTIKTKASTFKMDGMPQVGADELLAPSVAESDSKTSVVASEATRDIHIEVPSRPSTHDGFPMARFECKYCCLTTHVRSENGWKNHVLNDLQPYVCTYPDCSHSNHLFESQDEWYRHEAQLHRFEFICDTPEHPAFPHLAEFDLHLREEHPEIDHVNRPPLDLFKRPQPPGGTCNLCFGCSKNLRRHVARHLQQISLFALPRADYGANDEELKEGDSDAAQYLSAGSQSLRLGRESTESSDASSVSSHLDLIDVPEPMSELVGPSLTANEVPDTDETHWNFLTDKLSMARISHADIALTTSKRMAKFRTVVRVITACNYLRAILLTKLRPNYDRVKMHIVDIGGTTEVSRHVKTDTLVQFFTQQYLFEVSSGKNAWDKLYETSTSWAGFQGYESNSLKIIYLRNPLCDGFREARAFISYMASILPQSRPNADLIILDLQSHADLVLRFFDARRTLSPLLARGYPILLGLGDSGTLQTAGESASFNHALMSMLMLKSKSWTLLELRDGLNSIRERRGAYAYVAELLCPDGLETLRYRIHLYPLLKRKFRWAALAVWAAVVLRRGVVPRSHYRRVGVMLFWIRPGQPEGLEQPAAQVKTVTGLGRLRKLLEEEFHYEVWEPNINIEHPVFPQLKSFLDHFFDEFHKPGNLMFIYFEGLLRDEVSSKLALYESFVDVIDDYLKDLQADTLVFMHVHLSARGWMSIKKASRTSNDDFAPKYQVSLSTWNSALPANHMHTCFRTALAGKGALVLSKIATHERYVIPFPGLEIYPSSAGSSVPIYLLPLPDRKGQPPDQSPPPHEEDVSSHPQWQPPLSAQFIPVFVAENLYHMGPSNLDLAGTPLTGIPEEPDE